MTSTDDTAPLILFIDMPMRDEMDFKCLHEERKKKKKSDVEWVLFEEQLWTWLFVL